MLKISKVDDNNLLIEKDGKTIPVASVYYSQGDINIVSLIDKATGQKAFSDFITDIQVKSDPTGDFMTFTSVEDAVKELNSFVGLGFKSGGSSPSPTPTQWGDIDGTISNQVDLQSELDKKVNLQSKETQVIDSDITFDRGNQLLGMKADGNHATMARYAIYVTANEFTSSKTVFGTKYTSAEINETPKILNYISASRAVISTDGIYYYNNGTEWITFIPTSITEQLEIGSESEHLNVNTNNDPVYGIKITVDTPDGKKIIMYEDSEVLNNFALKSDIPEPIKPGVYDVSPMFNIQTNADISVFMFRRETEADKPLIKIHGFDDSGESNDLIITPAFGFGPNYDSFQAERDTLDGITFNDFAVKLDKETGLVNGKITIPNGLRTFDLNYHCHIGGNIKASYYIDTDNVVHPFELDNTPFENFCSSGSATAEITINGLQVIKNTIKEIVFGDSYNSISGIGDNFLYSLYSLTSLNLSPLTNVTNIGNSFLYSCRLLSSLDLSSLNNIINVGTGFLGNCVSLSSLDLSPLSNITHINSSFLLSCSGLTSLDLSPLSNVIKINNSFLFSCSGLTSLDLSPLSKVTDISGTFLSGCSSLTSLDLSTLSNVTNIGAAFLYNCTALKEIQIGNVNWASKTVSATNIMASVPNVSTSTLYTDTTTLATAFKTKMSGKISNWTVVINE